MQDNVKISPYKICFYAQLQGTPTVSSADLALWPLQKYHVDAFTLASHRLQDTCWFGKQRLTLRGWKAFRHGLKFCFFKRYNAVPSSYMPQLYFVAVSDVGQVPEPPARPRGRVRATEGDSEQPEHRSGTCQGHPAGTAVEM